MPVAVPTSVAVAEVPTQSLAAPVTGTDEVAASAGAAAVSQADVITWVNHGTSDDVIVDRLQHAPNAVHLTAGDEMKLRDAGVDADVIRALRAAAWN